MEIKVNMCFTQLISMQHHVDLFERAISSYACSSPRYESEGIAGYISCDVVFQVKDLTLFSELFSYKSILANHIYANLKLQRICS
jgi:hypothetical protein